MQSYVGEGDRAPPLFPPTAEGRTATLDGRGARIEERIGGHRILQPQAFPGVHYFHVGKLAGEREYMGREGSEFAKPATGGGGGSQGQREETATAFAIPF